MKIPNKIFSKLQNTDVGKNRNEIDGNKITNINIVSWVAAFTQFINTIYSFFEGYTYSFYACCLSFILIVGINIIFKKKYYKLLRISLIITLHASIILLNYIEGIVNGNFIYFFVIFLVYSFIYNSNETKNLIISYAICLFSIIIIFYVCPEHSIIQRQSESVEKFNFLFNFSFSIFLIFILCFIIFWRNKLKEKLIESKQHFLNTVFNTSLDAVLIVDAEDSKIKNCNNESLQIFGVNKESELIDKSFLDLFCNIPSELNLEALIHNKNKSWKGELECISSSGIIFPSYVSIVSFINDGKHFKKLSILNISDIKMAQNYLLKAKEKAEEATKAKSVFLSNMSHELRTPLNGIIGLTNLMVQEENNTKDNNYVELLKYTSTHMLELINDVLDLSKIEAGKIDMAKESFNMQNLLNNLKAFFTTQFSEKNISLRWEVNDNNFEKNFLADKTKITQVITNLLSNALKFTNKGYVKLSIKTEWTTEQMAKLNFYVSDTGIGIPEDKREIIFESFGQADTATTRKYGGTGLGLAISKKIIEHYNGGLSVVDNKEDKGSTFLFSIELPYAPKGIKENDVVNEILPSLQGLKVLVAEDNPINMIIVKKFLSKWNVDITTAVNGVIALDIVKSNNFDLLLLDLEMPEMDGHQLIKEIRKNKILTPAIAFTAAGYENIFHDLLSKGFNDYVQKPFQPEVLHKSIVEHSNFAA